MGLQALPPQGPGSSAAKQLVELSKDVNGLFSRCSEGQEEVKGKKDDKDKDHMKRVKIIYFTTKCTFTLKSVRS